MNRGANAVKTREPITHAMKTYENPIHTRPRDPPIHPALPRRTREIMERICERVDRFMERDMYTRNLIHN